MKKFLIILCALLCSQIVCLANEIHFDNEVYKLKFSAIAPNTSGFGNEYFKDDENVSNWTKMLGVYSYPNEDNPIKYAQKFDSTIENTENTVLLKRIENKKTNKSVVSFLVNGSENGRKYFEYDVYKFEKHPQKGMLVTKYASKNYFENESEIDEIAKQIKNDNDKYLEMLVISDPPRVIEEDIS